MVGAANVSNSCSASKLRRKLESEDSNYDSDHDRSPFLQQPSMTSPEPILAGVLQGSGQRQQKQLIPASVKAYPVQPVSHGDVSRQVKAKPKKNKEWIKKYIFRQNWNCKRLSDLWDIGGRVFWVRHFENSIRQRQCWGRHGSSHGRGLQKQGKQSPKSSLLKIMALLGQHGKEWVICPFPLSCPWLLKKSWKSIDFLYYQCILFSHVGGIRRPIRLHRGSAPEGPKKAWQVCRSEPASGRIDTLTEIKLALARCTADSDCNAQW